MSSLSNLKLGTLLRQISNQIGTTSSSEKISFYQNDEWDQCYHFDEIEILIFEAMKKMAEQYGLKASLKDIPIVYGNVDDITTKQFYPLYTVCNADNIYLSRLVRGNSVTS